jgi:hypothetical protein
MGYTTTRVQIDRDPDITDIAALEPTSGDMLVWNADGSRYNTVPSTSYMRGLLNTAGLGALQTALNFENGADVTDATNVAAAGAVMDGDYTTNGILERTGPGAYTSRDLDSPYQLQIIGRAENIIPLDADFTGVASSHDAMGETLDLLNTAGTGVIRPPKGSKIRFFPAYNSTAMPTLTGLRDVTFDWGGCELITAAVCTSGQTFFPFNFDGDNEGIHIGNVRLTMESPLDPSIANEGGAWWFNFENDGRGLTVDYIRATGGVAAVSFQRDSDATKRWRGITIRQIDAVQCGRPLRQSQNGDDLVCHLIRAWKCGRAYLANNWHGLSRVTVIEQDSYTQINLRNNSTGGSGYSNDSTSGDLDLRHIGLAPTGITGLGETYRIAVHQFGQGAGQIGNWKIHSRTRLSSSGPSTQGSIQVQKYDNSDVLDTTNNRGHTGSLTLDIGVDDAPASTTVAQLMANAASAGDWSAESGMSMDAKVRAKGSATGSSQVMFLAGVSGGPKVRMEIEASAGISRTGTPASGYWEQSNDKDGQYVYQGEALVPKVRVRKVEYTSNDTWNKPSGLVSVIVEAISAGGGGGGGARTASGNASSGGGGGGGGIRRRVHLLASQLLSSESISVGTAGTAGTGATSDGVAGGNGGGGGNSTFGAHILARGGGGGAGGQLGANSGGGGGAGLTTNGGSSTSSTAGTAGGGGGNAGGSGSAGSSTNTGGGGGGGGSNAALGNAGATGGDASGGGGSGGGIHATPANTAGGAGGLAGDRTTGGPATGGSSAAGQAGTDFSYAAGTGAGGGGGGSNAAGVGYAGGVGGNYGGGGGGGGSAVGGNGGAGGAGGGGIIRIWEYY